MARKNNGSLLVTPSGRTPSEAIAALQRAIFGVPHVIWDGIGENPYLAFLGIADAIVVTKHGYGGCWYWQAPLH